MKLVTFLAGAEQRIGALDVERDRIVDFQAASEALHGKANPDFRDMLALIDGGPDALDAARAAIKGAFEKAVSAALRRPDSVTLLAPVPQPRQMRDCLAFEQHYRQARAQALKVRAATYADPAAAAIELEKTGEFSIPEVWYQQPVYYKGNRFSVIGTGQDILWPRYAERLDYELEYGVFIGKKGKNIKAANARAHIFGYCIFNDISARDAQYKEYPVRLGPAKGKDFDTGNIMGPWLVTSDEMTDPYDLTMTGKINGEEWSRGHSGTMHHRFEAIIAHVSDEETLHPGEFLGSGTVGNGCGLELGRWLKDGDVIELEITGLGVLKNRIIRQPART